MDARSVIATIRDGATPPAEALAWFARGLASGAVSDAQAGAFAMAVLLRGLGDEGRGALVRGMRDSGRVLEWRLPGPVVDKHSTGGIGDATSLLLAPALAVCGAYVPMISGRGLGHTGGTLDKLEAIPGFRTDLSEAALRAQVARLGCAIVAASADLAPADRRLYAIRDISGTVESVDLITASILSKKLAAGLEALVLDVKCGSGAFMKTPEDAGLLARALVSAAREAGCATAALVTDMSRPLANAAGNALEVARVMETLTGSAVDRRLLELSVALGGEALALAGLVAGPSEGEARIRAAIEGGAATERFGEMVAAQGGPADFVDRWRAHLPAAPVIREVPAPAAGWIATVDGEALGLAVVRLGGGRMVQTDRVDPAVGLSDLALPGDQVAAGAPLARVHAASPEAAEAAIAAVRAAYALGPRPDAVPMILGRVA
jgi:thymidine phosphorylase